MIFRVWFATSRPPADHDWRFVHATGSSLADAALTAAQVVHACTPDAVMITRVEVVE